MAHQIHEGLIYLFSFVGLVAVLTTLFLPGHRAVYWVILTWFFFPNKATHLMGINEVPLFTFVQIFQSVALLLLVLKARREEKGFTPIRWEKHFIWLLAGTYFIQFIFGGLYLDFLYQGQVEIPFYDYLNNIVDELAAFVFLIACAQFIRTRKQIDFGLKVIALLGAVLTLEFYVTCNVPLLRSTIGRFTLGPAGEFFSIFLNDGEAAATWGALAGIIGAYLGLTASSRWYLLSACMSMAVPVFTFMRSAILGMTLAVTSFLTRTYLPKVPRSAGIVVTVAAIVFLANATGFRNQLAKIMPSQGTAWKVMTAFSSESAEIRLGLQLRAWQILGHSLPFGTGPFLEGRFMPLNEPHSLPFEVVRKLPENIRVGYQRPTVKKENTRAHNFIISYLVSYGLMGLLVIVMFFYYMLKSLAKATKSYQGSGALYSLTGLVSSAFLFYFAHYMFSAGALIYVIFMFIVHAAFLLGSGRLDQSGTRLAEEGSHAA